jgi:hypothetical protein
MPFAPIDTLPLEEPAVRIYFTGLMILEPIENDACQIFVNSSATRHYLTIEVRRKTETRPDEIMMRHVGPLAFFDPDGDPQIPLHGFHIEKVNAASTGVLRYTGSNIGPKGEEDFDRVVDIARAPYHDTDRQVDPDLSTPNLSRNLLDIDNLVGRPSIFLNDGILHTAAKTDPGLTITLRHPQKGDKGLTPFAKLIGANLYLNSGEVVRLRWLNQGKQASLELQKPDPGVSYEIYIINDPLFESSIATNLKLDPKHDEFAEYYKLLSAVPTNEQFRLHVEKPPAGAPPVPRGSTDIPCMSTTKGGGS